ncbi:MAG: DsbA family protein [Cyclobacteriaceae bacterium]
MENKQDQELCEDGVCETPDRRSASEVVSTQSDDSIIYFGDPMCSWCWGIAGHLKQLKDDFKGQLSFRIVLGGLRPGGGELWDDHMKSFLREHWEHVQEASSQPFNFGLLEQDEFNYDTEPASRAVRVVRDMDATKEFDFFKAVQYGFYADNRDPNYLEFYKPICEHMGLDFSDFSSKFQSDEYKSLVRQDFMFAQQLGIRGFPSVVVQSGEKYYMITRGYATYEAMTEAVEAVLGKSA